MEQIQPYLTLIFFSIAAFTFALPLNEWFVRVVLPRINRRPTRHLDAKAVFEHLSISLAASICCGLSYWQFWEALSFVVMGIAACIYIYKSLQARSTLLKISRRIENSRS